MPRLRDRWFAVSARAPWCVCSLQQRVLVTMRVGFFFARYFFFKCSDDFLSLACTRAAVPTLLNFASSSFYWMRPLQSADIRLF